jgi:hypothetical protein
VGHATGLRRLPSSALRSGSPSPRRWRRLQQGISGTATWIYGLFAAERVRVLPALVARNQEERAMSRSLGQQVGAVLRALCRLSWRLVRVFLLALGCAGPPMPAHEIRGRTPAVQHEAGARKR